MNGEQFKKQYADNLIDGGEYQDFVMDQLYMNGIPIANYSSKKYQLMKGENRAGIEIKFDRMLEDTGNLWIEVAEKSNLDNLEYVPSGIHRNSWLYVIGNFKEIYIFPQNILKMIAKKYLLRENGTKTSMGFLIPRNDAEKYAAKIIRVNGNGNVQSSRLRE